MEKPKDFLTSQDFEEQKKYIRKMLPKYVESITQRDPKKRHVYLCPFPECKEREHTNSSGGAFSIDATRERWKCFSCQKSGDIFDLIGYLNGYKSGSWDKTIQAEEFKKEYSKACEIFGLDPDFTPPKSEASQDPAPTVPEIQTKGAEDATPEAMPAPSAGQFKEYLEKCHEDCIEGSKGYEYLTKVRGFNDDVIRLARLGYDREKDVITIPYNQNCSYYSTRDLQPKHTDGTLNFWKPPKEVAGEEPIYNAPVLWRDAFCFVCEAQLDAISILQSGFKAVAVGGTGYNKLLKAFESKRPQHCLILCFDNDSAGKKGQKELAGHLDEKGIAYIEAQFSWDLYGQPQKDCNDLLRSNPEQLKADLLENIRAAKDHELETGHGLYSVGEYQSLFKRHQTTTKQRISTGFSTLDIALYGGFTNELYILSAETSIGKSAIACCLAQNIAASGIDVLYYALEMGRDEFIARGASMISREISNKPIPYAEILNYKWDESTQDFYRRPYSSYEPYVDEYMKRYGKHLYFIEGGFFGRTALNIAETAEEFKKSHNINQLVIVVDYLQRLKADPEDRAQRDAMSITSAAVQVLGNLASQKHNTVIAISSISNAQKGQRVTDAAGKYSGDIGYTGGILLGWNWHNYTDTNKDDVKEETAKTAKALGYREMILEVLKQRSGERDKKLTMFYYPAYNYFTAPNTEGKAKPHRK